MNEPLAERMRPQHIEDIVGQEHILGSKGVLRRAIQQKQLPSLILWGPPGIGKTSIAHVISNEMERPFYSLSAISSGVKAVREIIAKVKNTGIFSSNRAILFIDEIHRFSKSQQDALLGAVERGVITLIGATTENPSFEVNNALLSRTQVYTLQALTKDNMIELLHRALERDAYLSTLRVTIKEYDGMIALSGGDARKLYNILELAINHEVESEKTKITINNALIEQLSIERKIRFDKGGELHYDIISAFIKSVRGSDVQGALYWLARMIEGGEDVKFIARRLIILASEDIGLANTNALLIANQCAQAVQFVGYPEARIILSQATIYLTLSPKSNSAYLAIDQAIEAVRKHGDLEVPLHLRNAPTKLMKDLNYGMNYKYPHDFPQHYVDQEYLPEELKNHTFYHPVAQGMEKKIIQYLQSLKNS